MHAIKKSARRLAWHSETDSIFVRLKRARPLAAIPHDELPDEAAVEAALPQGSERTGRHSSEISVANNQASNQSRPQDVATVAAPSSRPSSLRLGGQTKTGVSQTLTSTSIDANIHNSHDLRKRILHRKNSSSSRHSAHSRRPKASRTFLTISSQLQVIFGSWPSLFYVFIPIGFGVYYGSESPQTVFACNFLAIVGGTVMIGAAADEINARVGNLVGGIFNVAVSNVPQLISSALLIRNGQYEIMKDSLLGVILLNVLLVTGLSFFCGGYNRHMQHFNVTRGQTVAQFLLLAVLAIVLPTALAYLGNASPSQVDQLSRGTAVIVMISYGLYLFFTLYTHNEDFTHPVEKVRKENLFTKEGPNETAVAMAMARVGAANAPIPGPEQHSIVVDHPDDFEDEEDEWVPRLSWTMSIAVLVISTTLLAFNTEFATSSIQGLLQRSAVTQQFLGLIIVPLLNCDPLPIQSAMRDGMDLSITITLDRCIQVAMVVIPIVVFIGWGMGVEEINLVFGRFVVVATFVAIIIVTYTVQWGRTNWLIGALFIKVYIIIGLSAYFINDSNG